MKIFAPIHATRLTAVRVALTSALLARLPAPVTPYRLIQQSVVAVDFAVQYVHPVPRRPSIPPIDALLGSVDRLVDTYFEAGGKAPALLLHDESFGVEAIEMMARYGRGLPAHVLPLALHDIGRAGHDMMVGAIALGCNQVFILADPRKTDETHPSARRSNSPETY